VEIEVLVIRHNLLIGWRWSTLCNLFHG